MRSTYSYEYNFYGQFKRDVVVKDIFRQYFVITFQNTEKEIVDTVVNIVASEGFLEGGKGVVQKSTRKKINVVSRSAYLSSC